MTLLMVMSCNHRIYVHGHPYLPDQPMRPEFTYTYLVINSYKFQYLSKGYGYNSSILRLPLIQTPLSGLQLFFSYLFFLVRFPQSHYVELTHLKQRLHDSVRFLSILVLQHLAQNDGNDLPRESIFVLEPTALLCLFITSLGKLFPIIVYFFLRLTMHLERDGFVEFENRTTVEGYELLPLDLEIHRQYRSRLPSVNFIPLFSIAGNTANL